MTGDLCTPLMQMFSLCPLEGKLLTLAESCTITRVVNLDQEKAEIILNITLKPGADDTWLHELEQVLAAAYQMNRVELKVILPNCCNEISLSWIQEQLSELFPPAHGLLAGAEMEEQDDVLSVTMRTGGAELLNPFLRRVESRAHDAFGRVVRIQLVENTEETDAAAVFQQTEQIRSQAVEATIKQNHKVSASKSEKKPAVPASETTFLGKPIHGEPVEIGKLDIDMGGVVVNGKVFSVHHKELTKRNAWIINFDITDGTGSITVSGFYENKQAQPLLEKIQEGKYLLIQGKLLIGKFSNEMELHPYAMAEGTPKPERQDTAEEKRVELHLHTRYSTMDGLTDVSGAVKRAIQWGHSAIAITDHGIAQAFPEAYNASGKGSKIKVILGTEAYYRNDVDDRVVVHGAWEQDLDDEIVCFDIETTGLDRRFERITEIGAVVLKNGEIIDKYNAFLNPGKSIPRTIVELTGITDEMVADAPGQEEGLNLFLDWVGNRPLAAHNADFDMGFLAEGCRRMGREFHNTSLDTLILCQNLIPKLGKYKLDVIAEYLDLPAFNHHRACDDAATVGYMLVPLYRNLKDMGVKTLQQINPVMRTLRSGAGNGGGKRRSANHLIVLAKNQTGLRNLYKLISLAHLEHFKRFPIMPKSLINENREGLIIGSACEAGELFRAVVDRKSWDELLRIASWYDYLEIQPICNNMYMLRDGIVDSEEELRDFNRTILALGKALNKPVCATGDVHFMDPEDEIYRHILLASKQFKDADSPLPIYFKTTDEMLEEFRYLGEDDCRKVVIEDPNRIAKWVDTIPPLPKKLFAPKLKDSAKELEYLVYSKAHELYGEELPQIVQDRIDLELPGIIERKYDVIYMSAQKLVQNSLEHGYLVGSRGSVGSSIVAFFSGITEVNSLAAHYRCPNCKHSDFEAGKDYGCGADMPDAWCPVCGTKYVKDGFNIPFETFLGFGGKKMPDIDLNFSGEYQAKAHRYTFELFGESHVFRAGTVGTVAEKTAFGYAKKYLDERGIHVPTAEINRLAKGCVGIKRTTGQHPGGMIVIPGDMEIYDFCPVQHPADDPNTDIVTTHFEYHSMEDNLLKLDMLGHDDPSMIRMLQDITGVDPQQIPLDDKDTLSIFISSKVLGYEDDKVLGPTGAVAIPEFNTKFTRGMLMDTKPTQFNTLIRLSGFSHGTDVWLGNARDLIVSGTATVDSTVGCRDDIMLYLMEQGVEPLTAFNIMEAVRKGKVKKGGFSEGWVETMKEHNVPDWYIESLAKIGYLFPKAHAAAYVMMAFRIAWFKVHRPLAFYAAFFSIRAKAIDATCMCQGMEVCRAKMQEIEAKDKPAAVEEDMLVTLEVFYEFYLRGFQMEKMDLYQSDATRFLVDEEKNALIPPFTACPGLGESAALSIVEARKGKEFISVEEFSNACPKVSKAHIEQLKIMGALDGIPDTSQITFF